MYDTNKDERFREGKLVGLAEAILVGRIAIEKGFCSMEVVDRIILHAIKQFGADQVCSVVDKLDPMI